MSGRLDARGPRFGAAVTTVVLVVVLLTSPSLLATLLLAFQALSFAIGAALGVSRTPTGLLYAHAVRPRLGPPSDFEDARPPQFAQAVGLAFAVVGLVGFLSGATLVGQVAVGLALVAALLNAAVGFCLGCEMYLLGKRLSRA